MSEIIREAGACRTGTTQLSAQDLDFRAVLEEQRRAHLQGPFPDKTIRVDRLRRALDALLHNEKEIAEALSADYGHRSIDQTFFVELMSTAKPFREAIRRVGSWMRPERRHVDLPFRMLGARAEIQYQPLGVVGCISPWNFPVNLTFTPLAGMLAAGNRVMIKPSEHTPEVSSLMASMISSAFDPSEISVTTGGPDVASAFSSLPFDHLLYTGGERVAKAIVRASAENLTPLTLELGGKSPVVVGKSADLDLAAARIAFGKIFNAGQICLAPDILLVSRDRLEETVTALEKAIEKMLPAENGVRDYVSIVNDANARRLRAYVEEAKSDHTRTIEFDWLKPGGSDSQKNVVPLTLVVDPPETHRIMNEEVFGPILIIKTYDSFDDAIEVINSRAHPLALYYFGKNKREIERLLSETHSGGVTINDVIMHYTMDDLPFGGIGSSGMGAYHGIHGFKQFSHARAVYHQSRFDLGKALRPPYGDAFKRVSRFLLSHG